MSKPEILIVGAGPSGLVLALSLLKNGVPVRIIEKTTTNRIGQRGAGLSPRTLEVYESLGVLEEVFKRAINVPMFCKYKMPGGIEVLKEFSPAPHLDPTPANPYLNFLLLGQDSQDKILRAELAELVCTVELGIELESLEQSEDCVRVKLLRHSLDDATAIPAVENSSYKWVIGADGAKGVVRKQAGLSFLGETTEYSFVVGDIRTEILLPNRWNIWGEASDVITIIRPTDTAGLYTFILGGLKISNTTNIIATEESLKAYIKLTTGGREDIKIKEFVWMSPYKLNIRMADTFRKGRVFLTGDAGHVHSPTGGQGLNTGVQDSFNLGWKLALVAKGLAQPSLLDSYNEERFPVVAEMLNITTDIMKKTLNNPREEEGSRSGNINQLGVNYRWSSIVINEAKGAGTEMSSPEKGSAYSIEVGGVVQPGDRAPDAPGLVRVENGSANGEPTRLFKLLKPAAHTILIFSGETDYKSTLVSLQKLDQGLVRPIVIAKAGTGADNADYAVFEDRHGYAHDAYKGPEGMTGILVIRPDGVLGARVGSTKGLERYFNGILGHAV